MNSPRATLVSVGLVILAGILTTFLWLELAAARKETAALRIELSDAFLRAHEQRVAARAAIRLAPVPSGQPPIVPAELTESLISPPPAFRRPPKTIEDRQARLASTRMGIPGMYPGLADELGLTEEEAERMYDLLAERQVDARAPARPQEPVLDGIRELLGEARFAQWQSYVATRNTRLQAATMASALARVGAPLDPVQQKALVTAMLDEERNLERDIIAISRMVDPDNPASRLAAQEALQARRGEGSTRVLDAVSGSLAPRQLTLLREQFERRAAADESVQRVRNQREGIAEAPDPG